jgi:hypothetical protein
MPIIAISLDPFRGRGEFVETSGREPRRLCISRENIVKAEEWCGASEFTRKPGLNQIPLFLID